ncbi:chemotaxis protein CheA [Primorskyibacter sp. S87]|uniref:chemotaxis protein CheA n=1 Tax=Primorskyibacter sp. S87 TaxID=3415126 RepID=UPI003C7DCD45
MVQNNKVLTVSYGTFSCTLEGFEESFDTMKAIAEYFRDLAADDRYFGAEPPQPDAEMLARIAEREITRRVEARQGDSGIVLRAADPSAALPAAAAPAVAEPVVEAPQDTAPVAQPEIAPAIAPAPPVAEPAPAPAAAAEPETAADLTDMAEDESADVPETVEVESPAADISEASAAEETVEPVAETTEAFFAAPVDLSADAMDDGDDEVEDLDAEPVAQAETAAAPESIAAKLQRIRAVVSSSETQAEDEAYDEEYAEDEHAEDYVAQTAAEISDALAEDDTHELAGEISEDDAGDSELAAVFDRLDAGEPILDEPETDASDALTAPDMATETEEKLSEALDSEFEEDLEEEAFVGHESIAESDLKNEADDSIFGDLDEAAMAEADEDDDELLNILGDAQQEQAAELPGQVIKVKRSEFGDAVASGELDVSDAGAIAEPDAQDADSSLSDEDEADLMRELAEVEADLRAGLDEFEDEDDQVGAVADAADMGAGHMADADTMGYEPLEEAYTDHAAASEEGASEDDLSRLLATADEKLEDPENSSSREAYSHLRAARAATEAERSAGGTMGTRSSNEEYRDDLASVVKPRRPVAGTSGRDRPAESDSRPAPLKLVAEQRVDTEEAKRGPVRPRRIATPLEDMEVTEPEGGFVAYAREMGANELPDLLEAAASYMSFVEGREQFSRPQLMNKVRQVEDQEFNREDGLRSFGQLLRDGKIEKTGGGRFAASGIIGFRPDEREAG